MSLPRAAVATALAATYAACTVFDGLQPAPASSNDGGADATSDASDAASPYPSYLSVADAVRVCTLSFACPNLKPSTLYSLHLPIDDTNFSSCVNWLAGPIPPNRPGLTEARTVLGCVAKATSCTTAGSCLSDELIDPGDPRCTGIDGGANRACSAGNGDVLDCDGLSILHCANVLYPPGSTCMAGADGQNWCALSKNCNTSAHCQGGLVEYCSAGGNLLMGISCTGDGMQCGLDTTASTYDCLTDGVVRSCATAGVTCSGPSVAVCTLVLGGRESTFDCANMGATCDDTGVPYCKGGSDTCTPRDQGMNACSGSSLSLCIGGATTSFDCASIGLKCAAGTNGKTAHCE